MAFAAAMINPDKCSVFYKVTIPSKEKPIGFLLNRKCSYEDRCEKKTNNTQGKLLLVCHTYFWSPCQASDVFHLCNASLVYRGYPMSSLGDKADILWYTTGKRCITLFKTLPLKRQWPTQAMPHTRMARREIWVQYLTLIWLVPRGTVNNLNVSLLEGDKMALSHKFTNLISWSFSI